MNVPKILHQTWKTHEMPDEISECIGSMRKLNPDWEHAFHTDDDWKAVVDSSGLFDWDEFMRFPTAIQRADIFRCLVLYERGGVYADVDTLGLRPLDSMIGAAVESGLIAEETEMILTTDHPIHSQFFYDGAEVIMNNFMVAKPGARFLKIFLDELRESVKTGTFEERDPVSTTGPLAMTEMIEKHGGIEELGIAVVPYFWVNPLPDMARDFPGKEAYDEILADGSWRARFCPYVVHCWWHSWWDHQSMTNFREMFLEPRLKKVVTAKFFHETPDGHHDLRFYSGEREMGEKKAVLADLLRAFTEICSQISVEPILMHGGLIGWIWNRKFLPWDSDIDLCVKHEELEQLAAFCESGGGYDRKLYLLEINPNHIHRVGRNRHHHDNRELNKIDARFFNLETGLFIDITALSSLREGWLSTKCPHHYSYDEIYPLRKSSFEGIEVNVPNSVEKLLVDEYGEGVRSSRYGDWSFDPDSRCWEQDR